MGRWTQYNEDSTRLPVGMKRIGYDADTARYTFCDREGKVYMGPAHEEYGLLSPIPEASCTPAARPTDDRPELFASASGQSSLLNLSDFPVQGSTFHDLLPPHLIASPSPSDESRGTPTGGDPSATLRFRDAIRRSALPAMQNAVNTVRRSATSVRKSRKRDNEKDGLLRSGSAPSIREKDVED
ncbi:hypothetical protein K438DRAFT_1569303 [Mycena galopus ATCC 62051]|nr:hypothetical protein K438DRAFT_1569303 [Mycena galopus ATCC 62051]